MTDAPQFHVVFAIFDRITQLDFTGPAQFLCRMPGAKLHVAAASLDPVMTDAGFAIDACEEEKLRMENGEPVIGLLITARRPAEN